jgi:hypothetical protein
VQTLEGDGAAEELGMIELERSMLKLGMADEEGMIELILDDATSLDDAGGMELDEATGDIELELLAGKEELTTLELEAGADEEELIFADDDDAQIEAFAPLQSPYPFWQPNPQYWFDWPQNP